MVKELRLSEVDFSVIEAWEAELEEEYCEVEYLEGFNEVDMREEEIEL